jgi:propanol-preferring alcohol dehydrogenase
VVRSVANLTRADGEEFFGVAARMPLRVSAEPLPLEEANEGLERLRSGRLRGAVVLAVGR